MNKSKLRKLLIGATIVLIGGAQLVTIRNLQSTNDELRDSLITMTDNYELRTQDLISTSINYDTLTKEMDKTMLRNEQLESKLNKICASVNCNPDNILSTSGATEVHMRKALKGTAMESLAPSFIKAEQRYGINVYILAGIVAQESSWGTSYRAQNDNNLTGFAVYSSMSRGGSFDSKEDNILKTAEILKKNYLTSSGSHYTGTAISNVNTNYCMLEDGTTPDYRWSGYVSDIATKLVNKSNN